MAIWIVEVEKELQRLRAENDELRRASAPSCEECERVQKLIAQNMLINSRQIKTENEQKARIQEAENAIHSLFGALWTEVKLPPSAAKYFSQYMQR